MQRSTIETIFLYALMALTLALSTGFVVATIGWGFGFPAVFVALILSVFIATLAYTSLGGVGGDLFKLGPVKLTGGIAAIAGVFWLVNGPMDESMKDAKAVAIGRDAQRLIDAAEEKAFEEQKLRHVAERKAAALEAAQTDEKIDSISAMLKLIEDSSAEDRLGKGVLQLYKEGRGPFDRTLQTLKLTARFNGDVEQGTFRYCREERPELDGKPVRFEVINPEEGTSQKIELKAGADIGSGLCSQIKFDVQLGCDSVAELLKSEASACDASNGIAWIEPKANKSYELVATILNPELM